MTHYPCRLLSGAPKFWAKDDPCAKEPRLMDTFFILCGKYSCKGQNLSGAGREERFWEINREKGCGCVVQLSLPLTHTWLRITLQKGKIYFGYRILEVLVRDWWALCCYCPWWGSTEGGSGQQRETDQPLAMVTKKEGEDQLDPCSPTPLQDKASWWSKDLSFGPTITF